ncbi:TonB family protein [Temperatibacter marinus]|uniref:TonB family protein n=1 Tax=Temperatibacter marinus TaxID=1456591 RepID=A0AA52HA32_9PROT|nr:TonB family protein [Temperatibacter marinus]WND03816.1 TonB family protein [Temperatibacter marinus]
MIKNSIIALLALFLMTTVDVQASEVKQWQTKLVKQISKYQKYPRSAMNREIEGRAIVRIVFNADGSVASHEVLESTGAKVLDREIPKVVNKLKMPQLPDGKETYSLKVPFTWLLG